MMKKIVGIIEGLVFLLLGVYIFMLILSGKYMYYLNPKFIWLTSISGACFIILGLFNLFNPSGRLNKIEIFVYIIFIVLCFIVPVKILSESNLLQSPF